MGALMKSFSTYSASTDSDMSAFEGIPAIFVIIAAMIISEGSYEAGRALERYRYSRKKQGL